VLAWILLVTSCSGASESTETTEPVPGAVSTDADAPVSSSDPDADDSGSDTSDPHCWEVATDRFECPRQITPTTWLNMHPWQGARMGVYPIEGSRIITAKASGTTDYVQVWDVEDFDWGRSVNIESQQGDSLDGRRTYLGNGLMGYRYGDPEDTDGFGVVVYDMLADEPTTPVTDRELAGFGRFIGPIGDDRFGLAARLDDTTELMVLSLNATEPLHTVTIDQDVSALTGDGADTIYYLTRRANQAWRWTPPAAPELIGPVPAPNRIPLADFYQISPSGRLLLSYGEFIDVFDPSTSETVTLTGVDPGFDNRFAALAISELPDGRIVGLYPAGEIAYWDVADPNNPTITSSDDEREWLAAGPVDSGELLVGWEIQADEAIELITPPAP